MRTALIVLLLIVAGCDSSNSEKANKPGAEPDPQADWGTMTLSEARAGFKTKLVSSGDDAGPPQAPPTDAFKLIRYPAEAGDLAAYITADPGGGKKHPAIVWITGGDNNSIGDVWSPMPRNNDQSASAYRKAGIVMMFPSQRGGNDNPGRREGFLGEADDILAATEYLAKLPYVDPEQIYLGGHSTGGTMAMMVAANSDRYRAVFAFGPIEKVSGYGDYTYWNITKRAEVRIRSPRYWLDSIATPTYVFEGVHRSNADALKVMADINKNDKIRFMLVPGHDHFSLLGPINEMLAKQIIKGEIKIDPSLVAELPETP